MLSEEEEKHSLILVWTFHVTYVASSKFVPVCDF